MSAGPISHDARQTARLTRVWPLVFLIALCTAIELVLLASDLGIAPDRLRRMATDWAGFWPGLLGSWQPNYPGQSWAMFASYAFLHAGPIHLAINMLTLWSLGRIVIDRVGALGFWALYAGAVLGGAATFGLIGDTLRPMVGASGALFGLVGGLLAWNYVDRYTFSEGLWPVARAALLLIAMNLVLWWAMDGQLAWETHLGGFVTGWVLALLIDPRGRAAPE